MKKLTLSLILLPALLSLMIACTPGATPTSAPEDATGDAVATGEVQAETPEVAEVDATATGAEPEPVEAPTEAPPATPSPFPTPSGPFPPVVLSTSPAPGAEQPLDEPVAITFDQPMDRASVEKAFAIEPGASVDGAFDWSDDDQTVRFTPDDGFQRGQRYRVRVVETAQNQDGLALTRPFEFRFSAAGYLEVANVQPAGGTGEVAVDSAIIVMFNRPVVALSAVEDQGRAPDPLTFTPPVSGEGVWLNTATYQFSPSDEGFLPATDYTARVSAGLADVFGQAVLEDDYEWTFTTISPAVAASIPVSGDMNVSSTPVMSIAFNQLMDHVSVEQNLLVIDEATGQPVPGELAWVSRGIIPPPPPDQYIDPYADPSTLPQPEPVGAETLTFTPVEPLAPGGAYQILLPQGVESQLGTATQNEFNAGFTVAPAPEVVSTNPPGGEQFADIWQGLDITFNTPMNPASMKVGENLLVEGANISATEVYTWWSNNATMVNINFPRRENQVYTVTLGADIESRDGAPLGEPVVITWQTLRQSPYVYIVSPKIGVYNGYNNETYVYMTVRNVSRVNFELYRLSVDDFRQLSRQSSRGWTGGYDWTQFQPGTADLLGAWSQETSPETFVNYVYKVDVSQAVSGGAPLEPGIYYLEAFANPEDYYDEAQVGQDGPPIDRQILIVSRNNLTLKQGHGDLLVWLTDLQSGQLVPEAPLTFFNPGGRPETGLTDDEGVTTFTFELPEDDPSAELLVVAGDPDDPTGNFAVGSNNWSSGIEPYEFESLFSRTGYRYSYDHASHIYTERKLYRPGQTVYFKGIVRADDDARYTVPTGSQKAQVVIYDAMYREIFSQEFALNEFGTFNGRLPLATEASLGNYQIELRYGNEDGFGYTAYGNFNVAEYRKPEFLVETATDQAEYLPGETIELAVEAEFFAGGPVANAPVRWALLSDDYYFQYTPSSGGGYYDFTHEDNSRINAFDARFTGFGRQIAGGEGTTDANGRFAVEVPADLTGQRTSQTYTFDVAVTGLNNQEVAGRSQAIVHQGDLYIGLRPAEYVGQVNRPNQVEVLVVDWDSQPVAEQEVELVFAEEEWYSVQQLDPEASRLSPDDQFYWQNLVETKAVFSATVTTGEDGQATAEFTPERSGSYKVYARIVDSGDRELFSSTFIWVSGSQYVNWGQEDHDRLELVADEPVYSTGDTATILVPHPYSGTVTALVTVERAHIYDHFVTELESNSAQIEIPITEIMSPNAYVSVVIMKGMDSPPVNGGGTGGVGVPSFKMGYTRLEVDPEEKRLTIDVTPVTDPGPDGVYQPNETVEYQVEVTDFTGEPVQAELSLALIDKAILTLFPETPGQLFQAFWEARALQVRTGSGLTLALDRINRALDERKGGGGGDGSIGPDSVRQNFADTALWLADLVTDENGQATVEVTLPENLTTWVMIAKGVTGDDTLAGETRNEIVTGKPLLVRTVTPRFFVVGDEALLGMVVQNNSEEPLTVLPTFEAEGVEIGEWRIGNGDWLPYDESEEFTVEPGQEVKVEYQTTVADVEQLRLTMGVAAAEMDVSDAIALELPVYQLTTPETVATVGVLPEDGARLEGVALPASFSPSQGGLTVSVEPSLAAGMRAGLDYLEHFPYECTEQTVSRFLPNIFTYRAYTDLEQENPALAGRLPDLVGIGVQRLISQQNVDGGWGWWQGSQSDPFLTAYVLLGLVEARRADFTVDQWITDNAVNYLNQALVAPRDMAEPWQANRQAFILYVLAEAGQGDLSRSVALFDQREMMDSYGRAFLALAIHTLDEEAAQIETLVSDLTNEAVTSATGAHWEEAVPDLRNMNTDTRSTAIVLTALARIEPDHPLLPQAVRWLMTQREQNGHWASTQETAWAIIGLTDWMVVTGELEASYAWQVSLNGQELGAGEVDQANLDETTDLQVEVESLLAGMVNRLAIERDPLSGAGETPGNLYYAAYLTYYKPVQEVQAIDRGIYVTRQYFLAPTSPVNGGGERGVSSQAQPVTEAEVGDFVTVKLTLVAPTDLNYVMIEDYLPAGVEAVDSSLATTSAVAEQTEGSRVGGEPWGRWYFNHADLRDEKAVIFADYLPQGVYEYTYTVRASLPGEFRVIPTHAEQMYFPEIFGRSDGGLFRVRQ